MQLALTFIAIVILASGILVTRNKNIPPNTKKVEIQKVLSDQQGESVVEENEEKINPMVPVLTPTPQPTQKPQESKLQDFVYPGSSVVSSDFELLILESNSGVDEITNWYKEKIRSEGFNAKTFVATSANGVVLNKLAGAKEGLEVTIEIKKNPDDTRVKITITQKSN